MALSEQTVESLEQRVPPPDWPHRHSALGRCGTPLIQRIRSGGGCRAITGVRIAGRVTGYSYKAVIQLFRLANSGSE